MDDMIMDHIRNFDWNKPTNQDPNFVDEKSLRNCVVNRILENRFHDPLIDIEPVPVVENVPKLDLSYIYRRYQYKQGQHRRVLVPGRRRTPRYFKQYSLTPYQQPQSLKVLCAQKLDVLKAQNAMMSMSMDIQQPNE